MRRFFLGSAEPLADDEVGIIAISAGVKRDGDEWVPSGVDLSNYNRNPVVCLNHDVDKIVGAAALALSGNQVAGRIKFAPPGISATADEARGLAKAGILTGVSAGINPLEAEPLDPRNPRGGVRILRCELLEVSLVAVQADPDARVVQRSFRDRPSHAALLRRLPSVSAAALDRVSAQLALGPEERRLAAVAAEFGDTLTPARMGAIIDEARRFGQSPEFRLRWLYAARGRVDRDANDYARRQAELRALER